MASGTAPSPLYFINSNRHSCPAVIFPGCPTAVLSSGLRLDGAFCSCFLQCRRNATFQQNTRDWDFFFFFFSSQSCSEKIHQTATGGSPDKHTTSHRKLKANFQSAFTSSRRTYSYAAEAGSKHNRKKERKKNKKHITSRLFNFLHWVWTLTWQEKKKNLQCFALKTEQKLFTSFAIILCIFLWCPSKWIGFAFHMSDCTAQYIFISASSCCGTHHASHLHPSTPSSITQAAESALHAEQVDAQKPHFFIFLFFLQQDWTWLRAGGAKSGSILRLFIYANPWQICCVLIWIYTHV